MVWEWCLKDDGFQNISRKSWEKKRNTNDKYKSQVFNENYFAAKFLDFGYEGEN